MINLANIDVRVDKGYQGEKHKEGNVHRIVAPPTLRKERGFSLLEIIIVIGLLVGVYTYALPQFRLFTGLELSSTLNRLAVDIRSAYDVAVLTGKVHRMVFQLETGEYWLEVTDRNDVFLGVEGLDRDLSKEEEEEERLAFRESFKVYEDMMDEVVHDPEENVDIVPLTPLIASKERLQKPQWTVIKNLEWQKRQVGPLLAIIAFQAEHHVKKQTREDGEEHVQGYLYFFPDGYVERAIIQLAPLADEDEVDRSAVPYTVKTDPYNGTATVISGREELDS